MHHPTTSKKSHLWVAANANEDPTAATTVPVVSSELLRSPFILVLLTVSALTCTSLAQNEAVVDELIDPVSLESSGGNLTVVFDDKRASNANTHFEAQHSSDITRWTGIENASIESHPLIPDRYILTAPDPGGERKFYRFIAYSTTATDQDGDGLSDTFELQDTRTDPSKSDSDNDGYDDGQEWAQGTLPNDPNSFPSLDLLPSVSFLESSFTAVEGEEGTTARVIADRPLTGTIFYQVHHTSTAVEGDDYVTFSGMATVIGEKVDIPIQLIDNDTIDAQNRAIVLDLIPTQDYSTGGRSRHVITIIDDDAYWSGVLRAGQLERDFRVQLVRSGATTEVVFVAGSGKDGLEDPTDVDPNSMADNTSQTEGLFPFGNHQATVIADTSSLFHVEVSLPMQARTKFFQGQQQALTLTLIAEVNPLETESDVISFTTIAGTYVQSCESNFGGNEPTRSSGAFVMIRNPM